VEISLLIVVVVVVMVGGGGCSGDEAEGSKIIVENAAQKRFISGETRMSRCIWQDSTLFRGSPNHHSNREPACAKEISTSCNVTFHYTYL
jgi:hypothetical protein